MSLAQVRPIFRQALNELGFVEHRDFLNFQNISSTLTNKSYHIETVSIQGQPADHQSVYDYSYNLVIRIFRHAYNDPVGTLEEMEQDVTEISCALLKASVRISGVLLDIVPGNINYLPIDASNDNYIVAELPFTARIKLKYT